MKKELLNSLKIYGLTWLIILVWFFIRGFTEELTIKKSFDQLLVLLTYKEFVIFIHVLFIALFLVFIVIRYFYRVYKKKGILAMIKQLSLRLVLPITIVILSFNYIVDQNTKDNYKYIWNASFENNNFSVTNHYKNDNKQRGMTVFGLFKENEEAISALLKDNIEWVAVVPFIGQKDEQSKEVRPKIKTIGTWNERDSLFMKSIIDLKEKNIKVMLKPHLWLTSGWRSNIDLESKKDWNQWFGTYRRNILHYAHMAEFNNVELFCIGTELSSSIKEQPELWKQLIKDIKQIYKGKLTYAANWYDEYEHITFWNDLDFIGIQAYFPLTDHKNPELDTIKQGWIPHKEKLKQLSDQYNKPLLFTEIGYRSDASATIEPWEWNSLANITTNQRSTKTQQMAFEAMFETFWNEPWFAGTYIWQWDTRSKKERALESFDFSPRFKPAENTIAKWYGNYNSLQE